jgi:hypothetical protein
MTHAPLADLALFLRIGIVGSHPVCDPTVARLPLPRKLRLR